uniref:Uncharacterized protein n=2 Tax=environmental samples TaxID=68359 RepID=A0A075HT23_9EURY|nr:hypothetical protein [uncultured marine group II/III euryarchaeote KM3_15_B02]AIF17028.1 hypothetical protein [uncultured marine group II/III euryarchaeote KM3_75_F08]
MITSIFMALTLRTGKKRLKAWLGSRTRILTQSSEYPKTAQCYLPMRLLVRRYCLGSAWILAAGSRMRLWSLFLVYLRQENSWIWTTQLMGEYMPALACRSRSIRT